MHSSTFAVRQVQQLQHFFRVAGQLFQGIHRIFRTNDLHHLDLVELVHADQTAGVAAVRTGFRAEAWRVCSHFQRQSFLFHDLVAHQVGQRHFRRWDQRVVAAVGFFFQRTGMEQVFAELRQLAGTVQRGVVNQIRHIGLQVAVLLGVQIQHELGQRAVHAGDLPFHHHEARTGQLNRGGKIQPAGHFAQIDVIAHREVVLARFAPAGNFQVSLSSLPSGTASSGRLGSVRA